jgi:serine protease Do
MSTRARTLASFFTVAMAAMLAGAVVTTQVQGPAVALARPLDAATATALAAPGQGAPLGLDTFREIARQNTAGVVNIGTKKTIHRSRSRDPFRDFFGDDMMERFFGPQGRGNGGGGRGETVQSLGSGFVLDSDGYILTNRHVIDDADEISVTLSTQKPGDNPYTAKLVGKDARTDVALLKIEPKSPLTILQLGDSDRTEVGDWVMAIGNPFGLGGNSVTVGVVSYKGRPLALSGQQGTSVEMIQTDASINPGNSGGPLLNTRGEVIGINTMIITGGSQQSSGVGFAVPINVAKEVLTQLRVSGKVVRGWLGVQIFPVTEDSAKTFKLKDRRGAVVVDVTSGGPAEKAGLRPEDIVVRVDGRSIEDPSELSHYIAGKPPGTSVKLDIMRNGAEKTLSVPLGTFPEEVQSDDEQGHADASDQYGLTLRNLTPDLADQLELPRGTKGVVVVDVDGGAGEQAGLRQRDVIVSVNGANVSDVGAFRREIEQAKRDGVARLRVRRGAGYVLAFLRLK